MKKKHEIEVALSVNEKKSTVNGSTALSEGETSGIVSRYKKNQSSGMAAISFGLIKNNYEHAIEYTGIAKGTRGILMLTALLAACFTFWGGQDILFRMLNRESDGLFDVIPGIATIACFAIGSYMGIKYTRFELFRPEDEPTIFDRKNRKVYRIFRETYSGWRGLFLPWPLRSAEYDWDLVDAEHQAAVTTTGSTVNRIHALIFLVRKSADDPTIVDSFTIGNSMQMGEVTVPAVWEHIRRFMEEDGPHLAPGEVLQSFDPPKGFLQCMVATGPYGKNFRTWWRDYPLLMVMGLVFFPIVFPLMTLVGIFSWLSYKTAIPIKWSPAVLAALGPAIKQAK
ncbi:hypothetical protein RugamoR64_28400 [Duganella rhizosphaerae]|uniref:DUF6708 domain-containing protein n=1 Tax=Duganella rhizosphaerae TaxID=2885763 RepID=UPI0030E7E8A6